MIGRRYDQRTTSDRSSACAALISNISQRDRAKDVEQFDDVLRNFISETNKYEGRFGKIRDEEKTLSVKKLMPTTSCPPRWKTLSLTRSRRSQHPRRRKTTRAHQWTSAWLQESMARKHLKNGTEKRLNLLCKQCTRDQEAKVVGTEERVPVGACRSTSTAKVK